MLNRLGLPVNYPPMDRSLSDVPLSPSTSVSSSAFNSNPGIANSVPPIAISVAGNEEFLDKVAALFVRQVLAARERERDQKAKHKQSTESDQRPDQVENLS